MTPVNQKRMFDRLAAEGRAQGLCGRTSATAGIDLLAIRTSDYSGELAISG